MTSTATSARTEKPKKAIEQMDAREAIELLGRCDKYAAPCVFRLLNPAVQAELRRAVHRYHGEQA